ncbi:HTH domain [Mycobacterium tuberculosis]|nr:HTH domain [Mycobacterium tuberculosis]
MSYQKKRLFSASEISDFLYCEEQHRLKKLEKKGLIQIEDQDRIDSRLEDGRRYHQQYSQRFRPNQKRTAKNKGGCGLHCNPQIFQLFPVVVDRLTGNPSFIGCGKYKYSNPQDVDSIIHFLKRQGVNQLSLYIVDTMRQSMDGSDSSDQDVQNFLDGVARIQQEFQCAVLVVHHMGKDKSKGMRGSTALEGAADSVIYADKVSEEFLALNNQKQKDGKDGREMNVRAELVPIEMHGQSLTVPVMTITEHQGRIPRDNDTLNKLLAALEGNEKGLSVTGLADKAGVSRQTVHNYRKQLEDLGVTVEVKGNRTLFHPVNPSL